MLKNKLNFLVYCLLFTTAVLHAQVSFVTKVSKSRLGVNERLRVSFEMNENGDNFTPPNFNGFTVVGGPNQAVSNRWVNGVRSFSKTYTYFLTPTQQGKATIGSASIEIKGEVYTTNPVEVVVTKAVNNPNSPQARANAFVDDNLHLVAELSKSSPFVNEGITIVYKLYFSSEISVSNVNETDQPKYADFWSHMLPIQKLTIKQGTYKGKPYNYVTWRKTVLYPQKTGKLVIEPLTLNVSVDVPTNRRDFFGTRVYQKTPKKITAGKKTINVRPLPLSGQPESFEGAVGDFDFNLTLNKTALKSSESLQATVKVSGRGNLSLFTLPKLTAPSSLEVYEPEHNESIKTNLLGMQGSISDTYTIVPQYQGKYPLPPVVFTYFDPVVEEYITLRSENTTIDVYEGPQAQTPSSSNPTRSSIPLKEAYFDFIKLNTVLMPMKSESFYPSFTFYIALLLPLFLYLLVVLVRYLVVNRTRDVASEKQKRTNRLAKKYLSSAKKALGNKERFYEALERALHNYLKAKLSIETAEIAKDRIERLLKEKGGNPSTIAAFVALLNQCEAARYSPLTAIDMDKNYQEAMALISKLDKEL